jgi:excisionase family DNA binding protein
MGAIVSGAPVEERWLSVKEVSAIIGFSCDTVRRRIKSGELEAFKLPGRSNKRRRIYECFRIAYSEVLQFIRRNKA